MYFIFYGIAEATGLNFICFVVFSVEVLCFKNVLTLQVVCSACTEIDINNGVCGTHGPDINDGW